MAIWQYKIFVLPEDEVMGYFEDSASITAAAFDSIRWWRSNQLKIRDFEVFHTLLLPSKSWSKDIHIIGETDSTCIEILLDGNDIEEVSVRVDLRYNYVPFLKLLCSFAKKHNCIFLDIKFNLITANVGIVLNCIENHPDYKNFLDKLKG